MEEAFLINVFEHTTGTGNLTNIHDNDFDPEKGDTSVSWCKRISISDCANNDWYNNGKDKMNICESYCWLEMISSSILTHPFKMNRSASCYNLTSRCWTNVRCVYNRCSGNSGTVVVIGPLRQLWLWCDWNCSWDVHRHRRHNLSLPIHCKWYGPNSECGVYEWIVIPLSA